jgi:UDP-N-acetylmuramoyl-L-alanyl-D-glutamate--2,6-diaminopimelate ligase
MLWSEVKEILGVLPEHINLQERVPGIWDDSRRVQTGGIFLAVQGHNADGQRFIDDALQRGAALVLTQGVAQGLNVVSVKDIKDTRVLLADAFYKQPLKNLQIHGVTGTNGKTTIAFLIRAIFREAGITSGLSGTIQVCVGEECKVATLTTPGVLDLYQWLGECAEAGCTDVIMEVSSHALDQGRVAGLRFNSAVFTNLTQDHLDYHAGMEDYFQAKSRLFREYLAGKAFVQVDDAYGARLAQSIDESALLSVGVRSHAHLSVADFEYNEEGMLITLQYEGQSYAIQTALWGDFNAENVALACGVALERGISFDVIAQALRMAQVPGRFEVVSRRGARTAVVDYAHTPDALERVLESARKLCTGRLVCVFGCGGDRDQAKRPLMGEAASRIADYAILTADNPRSEDPQQIFEHTLAGMHQERTDLVENRREAIVKGVKMLTPGDWLVVAGKGHEDYQILADGKIHFDDREEVAQAMKDAVWE